MVKITVKKLAENPIWVEVFNHTIIKLNIHKNIRKLDF